MDKDSLNDNSNETEKQDVSQSDIDEMALIDDVFLDTKIAAYFKAPIL
ncbi:MAG: hypothetical protein IJY61_06290 [Candidatus Gastranaerophilales bacterium]|nr:hypothetical protein [Candidatus Gastranaerophilales bacterium]